MGGGTRGTFASLSSAHHLLSSAVPPPKKKSCLEKFQPLFYSPRYPGSASCVRFLSTLRSAHVAKCDSQLSTRSLSLSIRSLRCPKASRLGSCSHACGSWLPYGPTLWPRLPCICGSDTQATHPGGYCERNSSFSLLLHAPRDTTPNVASTPGMIQDPICKSACEAIVPTPCSTPESLTS